MLQWLTGMSTVDLCTTEEMTEKIKNILSKHITNHKVYDWHVADILHISSENLATIKKRDKPPLKEIILFCDRCGLDPMKIILKKYS